MANQITKILSMLEKKGFKIQGTITLENKDFTIKLNTSSVHPGEIYDVEVSKEVYYGEDPKFKDNKFNKVTYTIEGKLFNGKVLSRFETLLNQDVKDVIFLRATPPIRKKNCVVCNPRSRRDTKPKVKCVKDDVLINSKS
jgi:hypothetical protein